MSEKYYYTKRVDPDVLNDAILLRTTLRKVLVGCYVKLGNDDFIPENNIELEFTRALTSAEQDEITIIVNALGPEYDLVVRNNIEKNVMAWAESQGKKILRQFAANNIYRSKSPEQIKALVVDYADIVHSLVTGSLQTALSIFQAMSPDANISQVEIDEFILRLKIALGL